MMMMEQWKKELYDFWAGVKAGNDAGARYGVDPRGWRKESHIPYMGDYHPMHVLNLYYPEDFLPDALTPGTRATGDGDAQASAAGDIGGGGAPGRLPTIIDIHGGGWMYGTVDDSERYLGWLAAQGYAVMGMNYRLLQETDLRGIVSDIYASLHWLEQYGEARGFDLGRILLTGDSAGGHLANLIACIQQSGELQRIYGVEPAQLAINALCVCCPCAETDRLYILDSGDTERGRGTAAAYRVLMLGEAGEDAAWNGHMSTSETIRGLHLPPMLVIGSEVESLHMQTKLLLDTLDKTGQEYETCIWKREDGCHLQHVFNVAHWEWQESVVSNRRMLDFFRHHSL